MYGIRPVATSPSSDETAATQRELRSDPFDFVGVTIITITITITISISITISIVVRLNHLAKIPLPPA